MRYFIIALVLTACAAPSQKTPYTLTSADMGLVLDSLNLRDPGSAQFRNVRSARFENGDIAVCGDVNAKNAFGGYAGFQTFSSTLDMQNGARGFTGDLALLSCGVDLPTNQFPPQANLPAV